MTSDAGRYSRCYTVEVCLQSENASSRGSYGSWSYDAESIPQHYVSERPVIPPLLFFA
ncbi:uncharacterized, partial [Tachysurus ichikawai]